MAMRWSTRRDRLRPCIGHSHMLIVPAIDLKGGKCVRLLRGEMNAETVYGDDPVAMGQRWVSEGAQYLHVVDLDGAVSGQRGERRSHRSTLQGAADSDRGRRRRAHRGARRRVARQRCRPRHLRHRGARASGRRCARRAGAFRDASPWASTRATARSRSQGWTETSRTTAIDLARRSKASAPAASSTPTSAATARSEGVNVEATRALAEAIAIPVTASGGVGSLDDIPRCAPPASRASTQ